MDDMRIFHREKKIDERQILIEHGHEHLQSMKAEAYDRLQANHYLRREARWAVQDQCL